MHHYNRTNPIVVEHILTDEKQKIVLSSFPFVKVAKTCNDKYRVFRACFRDMHIVEQLAQVAGNSGQESDINLPFSGVQIAT